MSAPDIAINLLSGASETGESFVIQRGGTFVFAVDGTFNAGSAKLQMLSPDGVSYLDIGDYATMTAEGACLVDLCAGTYRAALTGSPSAMYAFLRQVRTWE